MDLLNSPVVFPRSANAVFCDDIRREVGGKETLLGVYSDILIVPEFPARLPTFVVRITARTALEDPFHSLQFFLFKDSDVLAEHAPTAEFIRQAGGKIRKHGDVMKPPVGFAITGHAIDFRFTPLDLAGPCLLRTRVLADGKQLPAGGLTIMSQAEYEAKRQEIANQAGN